MQCITRFLGFGCICLCLGIITWEIANNSSLLYRILRKLLTCCELLTYIPMYFTFFFKVLSFSNHVHYYHHRQEWECVIMHNYYTALFQTLFIVKSRTDATNKYFLLKDFFLLKILLIFFICIGYSFSCQVQWILYKIDTNVKEDN